MSISIPDTVSNLTKKKMSAFTDFLQARGSQVLATTNPYEVMRFTGSDGSPCVIYRKESGILRWSDRAREAYQAFSTGTPWRAVEKVKRSAKRSKRMNLLKTLADRDGVACFYCSDAGILEEMTVEHFVPVSSGGPNHISNMAIACRACNSEAGHLCVSEKMKLAMRKRGEA